MARKLAPPKTIRLAGRTFPLLMQKTLLKSKDCMGLYSPTSGTIKIDSSMGSDIQKCILLHEVFHDFDQQTQIGLDEKGVSTLAAFMFGFMRDNPELIKWLMQE